MFCNTYYPLAADIYYATESQDEFGAIDKAWVFNQTVRVDMSMSTNYKDQQMQADMMVWVQDMISGRTPTDIRIDSSGGLHSLTDILVTNVRNDSDEVIYFETAGARTGEPTLFEVAGLLPHNGPWGRNDYYKLVIKRSMVQEAI